MKDLSKIFLIIIFLISPFFLFVEKDSVLENENLQENSFLVTNVVDGDTIDVSINNEPVRIRLLGIDTPETVHPNKPVECFGKEASEIVKNSLQNKHVILEPDPTQANEDKYGRLLRYIYLEDGTLFNQWLIEEGYAFEYTYEIPYQYQTEFQIAEENAQNSQKGLWAEGVCDY